MTDEKRVSAEEPPQDVVSSVLSFYGSQLTSHASLMIGLVVALFALIQAHGLLVEWVFQFAAVSVVSGVIYSMFRVVLYGSLSGVLMHGGVEAYRTFLTGQDKLFEHALVDGFAWSELEKKTIVRSEFYRLRGSYSPWAKRVVKFWIQPPMIVSVVAAILVAGATFGLSAAIVLKALDLLVVIVFLLLVLSLRFARTLSELRLSSLEA
jgi:hypothetical protein